MDIGVVMFPTAESIQPAELARQVEARGFESLWFPEHSHIPTSRETAWGGRKGAPPMPRRYWQLCDQFVGLAACAAVTSKVRLGTGVTLVAQRDPISLSQGDESTACNRPIGLAIGWHRLAMVRESRCSWLLMLG